MLLHYNKEKLADVIEKFHSLTGMSVSVADTEYNCVVRFPEVSNSFCKMIQSSPEGRYGCRMSDEALYKKCKEEHRAVTHKCHAGLCDTAVPVYNEGVLMGFIIFGQVMSADADPTSLDEILQKTGDLGLSEGEVREAYESLMFFDSKKIDSAAEIVTLLTKYICLGHLIEPQYNEVMEALVDYIEENLTEKITVSSLCERFHISQNTLYGYFKSHFECTVGDYISRRRMRLARQLLVTTDLPVYDICVRSGIDNYQYFCRYFKQKNGETPLKYRKRHLKERGK